MDQLDVTASIRFVNDSWKTTPGIPRIDSGDERRANTTFRDVPILNARPLQERGELDLETNGFILMSHKTAVEDFTNPEEIKTTYFTEMSALIESVTGADAVIPFNYLVRTEDRVNNWANAYARYVHLDYNETSAVELMRNLAAKNGHCEDPVVDDYSYHSPLEGLPRHLAMYNCWQPIVQEVQRNPLTLIDAQSLEDDDLVDYIIQGAVGALPVRREGQRMYYFPRMQRDELILFKQADTRPGHARCCPHTSFDDPNSPENALGRRSIETRFVAVFGEPAA